MASQSASNDFSRARVKVYLVCLVYSVDLLGERRRTSSVGPARRPVVTDALDVFNVEVAAFLIECEV
jgi:hypothetical protein